MKLIHKQKKKLMDEYRKDLFALEIESDGYEEYVSERLKVWEFVFDVLYGRK